MTMIVFKGRTVLVADTNVEDFPSAKDWFQFLSPVRIANLFGFDPKSCFSFAFNIWKANL